MDALEICNRYDRLVSERRQFDYTLELIERFIMPGRGRFFREGMDLEESIDFRHRELYDMTAPMSVNQLASSMHGSLTSPVALWHNLRFRQEELNDSKEASTWAEEASKAQSASFNESNFNLEVVELYTDAAGYGTSLMMHEENPGPINEWNGHRFKAPMMRENYFEEDWLGRLLATYRYRQYTVRQLVDWFGLEGVPQTIREKAEGTDAVSEKETVIHCIYKRKLGPDESMPDRSGLLAPKRRMYQGKYILYSSKTQLGKTAGYYEFPGYLLRWARTAGSKFGHSPGIISLPNVLSVNQLIENIHGATTKAVDPPMKTPNRNVIGDLEMQSAGLTVCKYPEQLQPLLPPNAYRIDTGWADVEFLVKGIRQAFYVDQLELKDSPAMTATEVRVRYELMQRLLGPTLGRIQNDFLNPLIERSFWMMYRKGALPEMPAIVADKQGEFDIEYIGPLARSQKMHAIDAAERWAMLIQGLAGLDPEVLDNPDYDVMIRDAAEILGVPARWSRSETEVKRRRDARAEDANTAKALGAAESAGRAAKDLKEAGALGQLAAVAGGRPQ